MADTPDFERIRKTLLLQGEPDRVPVMELGIDRDVKGAFLGRPVRMLEDEVDFWMTAGYDYAPLEIGMRTLIPLATGSVQVMEGVSDFSGASNVARASYSVIEAEERERRWAEEGTGIIAGWEQFDALRWPNPASFDYSPFEQVQRYLPAGAKVIACMGYIFSTPLRLMGFQNFCEKLIEEPELVARLFEKTAEIQMGVFERVIKMDIVGALWQADDIAYADALMVAPRYLKKHVWPVYKEMGTICKEMDKPMIYHSDGKLDEVLDDIVECGFTTLHPIEPKAMDIVQVKREYGDKLSLIGNIDLGYTLTRGTPEDVEVEVRERIRALAPGGGYAVGSANSVTEYVPLANFNAMLEATLKYGRYPIQA